MALQYEYFCKSNRRSVKVRHGMNERLTTWSELCKLSGESIGDTDPLAEVTRVVTGGSLALPRRVSKEPPKSDYDPLLHGTDNCVPCCSKSPSS